MNELIPPVSEQLSDSTPESFQAYARFVEKLDGVIEEAQQYYQAQMPGQIQCKAGCFSCCRNDFRVSLIESMVLAHAIRRLPSAVQEQIGSAAHRSENTNCPLLLDGQCSVYAERPVLCRIFGLPVFDGEQMATCELNFQAHRATDFTAKAFDQQILRQTTDMLSRLYLQECGQNPESESLPSFFIRDIVAAYCLDDSASQIE